VSNKSQDDVVIEPKSIKINLTPYAQATFVRDLDHAIDSIDTSERFSAAKYFLVCLSIELSIKSCLLAIGVSSAKIRKLSHSLDELSKSFKANVNDSILTKEYTEILAKVTPFYFKDGAYSKGIVYFEENMKEQALKGYKDLPDLESLVAIKNKLHELLEGNEYYIRL
jgi:HEPN domain-containing protein